MAFLAKTSTPSEWKAVVSTIQTLVEEASFEATAEGITFRAMDPSHVALVDLSWPNSAFQKYSCDKQFKFTVRVEDFVKLVKRAESGDSVEISTSDDETLLLKLSNGYARQFTIHLIESTYGPTPLPKLSFNTRILLTEAIFERILSDVAAVSDHVTLEAKSGSLSFSGKSDTGAATVTLKKDDWLELEVKEDSKATYSLDYLLNITKAAGRASDTVVCEYSSRMPLRLKFKLSDAGGRIHFYLAPRIEER